MSLFLSLCITGAAAASVEEVTHRLERLRLNGDPASDATHKSGSSRSEWLQLLSAEWLRPRPRRAASDMLHGNSHKVENGFKVADRLAAIRSGSFLSLSDFKRIVPLKRLLVDKPELFLRPDMSDPVEDLATSLAVTRREAVKNFIEHNYYQLNIAFEKMLTSTNDVVIAAVAIDPFGAADAVFVQPITLVLIDYFRVRAGRCMQDLLPDVFQNPAVYDQYFTTLPGYRVIPNLERGFTVVIPDDIPQPRPGNQKVSSLASIGDSPIIKIHWLLGDNTLGSALVDVRCGCAVRLNSPYSFAHFFERDNWLVLRNDQTNHFHIWRRDSHEPLILPIDGAYPYVIFKRFVDMSRVIVSSRGEIYSLPNDPNVPFVATVLAEMPSGESLQPTRRKELMYNTVGDGTVVSPSQSGLERAERVVADLSTGLSEAFACSMSELYYRIICGIDHIGDELGIIALLISSVRFYAIGNSWIYIMELTSRFNLRTKEEFIAFIVAVVNGHRPEGISRERPMRFFLEKETIRSVVPVNLPIPKRDRLTKRRVMAGLIVISMALAVAAIRY